MAAKPLRSLALYKQLLRLYPRPFRDRFAQSMAQTFRDLARERPRLFPFALWVFAETSVSIARENLSHMTQFKQTLLRPALFALALLMVPLVASQFVEDWHWGFGGFLFAYLMFFATALAYSLIARHMGAWSYKAAVAIALASGFVMGWSTMVHISESENPANFVYFGVLAIGAAGAAFARLKARGMAFALFAMAAALSLIAIVNIWRPIDSPAGPVWNIGIAHGAMVLVFLASGFLFRHASLAETSDHR